MVNQSPRTARGAFFATAGLGFPRGRLFPCAKVQVWPRKVRGILSSKRTQRSRFHLCMNASCVRGYVSAKYFFPMLSPGWRRCRKPDPRLNPDLIGASCQESRSSEFVNLPSPLFPSSCLYRETTRSRLGERTWTGSVVYFRKDLGYVVV